MEDTPPEIEALWLERLRQRTPAERFLRVGELMRAFFMNGSEGLKSLATKSRFAGVLADGENRNAR
jgi:hypothetical protein